MNKKIIIPTLTSLALVGTLTLSSVNAQEATKNNLHQRLAQKLGLEESQVQTAFDEIRSDKQVEMQADFEERLNTLLSEGKITENQKTAILAKHEEMVANRPEKGNRENMKNLTQEEKEAERETRQAEMETRKAELESWATENGLNLEELDLFTKGEGREEMKGFGSRGGFRNNQ